MTMYTSTQLPNRRPHTVSVWLHFTSHMTSRLQNVLNTTWALDTSLWTLSSKRFTLLNHVTCTVFFPVFLCRLLFNRISYKDHITNEEVRAKIQQAIGPHEDLLTIVKRRKLPWYGHVSRSSGLAKTILQDTVKGRRRQGRQRKRWEDIWEWTGLEFGKSQRAVENKDNGRK